MGRFAMELRHLHYFLKIAETASFTQAAALLRVTQPTLSHQIKQLENEIGAPLFDRIGRSIRLTEHGRAFREHAERALKEIETGVTAVSELEGLMHGSLTIGVFRSFSSSRLPSVFGKFHHAYPRIRIMVGQMSLVEMETGLLDGALNLAVTTHVPPASDKIVSEEIFTEPLVLAVSSRHPLYGRARVRVDDLRDLPLVLRATDTPSRQMIERCFAARHIPLRIAMEMNSVEATLAMVRHSTLATICAERALEVEAGLRAVRIADPALERTGAILWHRDRYRSAAARILAQMIQDAYARRAGRPADRRRRLSSPLAPRA